MKTVTVIVPVYNVEDHLPQCLDSIVRQSFTQLEIIVVDDGSTDGSGRICDEYAARDTRMRVIHKANGGLSDARNAALDVMNGQLVTMVDGDDWLQLDAIQHLYGLMESADVDVAVGGWRITSNPESAQDMDSPTPPARCEIMDTDTCMSNIFYQRRITHSACGRLFKRELFDNLRFDKGLLYGDLAIAYDLYRQVTAVAVTQAKLYNYLQRSSSITGHFTMQRTHVLDILERLEQRIAIEAPQHTAAVQSRLLSAYFNILILCPNTEQYQTVVERCWCGIKRLRQICLRDSNVRLKNKAGIVASLLGKRMFVHFFGRNRVKE